MEQETIHSAMLLPSGWSIRRWGAAENGSRGDESRGGRRSQSAILSQFDSNQGGESAAERGDTGDGNLGRIGGNRRRKF